MPEKKSRSETLQLLFCCLGRAAVLAKENAVARLYVERNRFALLALAAAYGDHFALHGLLFRRVWDDDAATDRFLLLDSLHDHSVVQRSQSDCHLELPPLVNLLMKSGRE